MPLSITEIQDQNPLPHFLKGLLDFSKLLTYFYIEHMFILRLQRTVDWEEMQWISDLSKDSSVTTIMLTDNSGLP